jgi:hypothetical protein
MTTKKHFVERRRIERFKVKEGTFAEFHRPGLFKFPKFRLFESMPIIDISLNGLAFQYTGRTTWSPNLNELSISRIAGDVKIEKVPCKAVSDFSVSTVANSIFLRRCGANILRRCGVKFGELSPAQKSQLDQLIQNHTIK